MNKPSWEDAPDWANYLAMDRDGTWWWFELKPFLKDSVWDEDSIHGKVEHAPYSWKKTLEERPRQAIDDYLAREAWQVQEIEDGIREADAGEFATDVEVNSVFSRKF